MRFLSLLLFSFSLTAVVAQTPEIPWELRRNEDGIQLFTRPLAGSNLDEVKATVSLTGNIDSAFRFFADPIKSSATDPYISYIRVEKKETENDIYAYMIIRMPFFMKDRDMVVRSRSTATANGYFISAEPAEDIVPLVAHLVRDNNFRTYVSLQRLTSDSFELTYKVNVTHSDAPAGIANKTMITSTFERMKLLRNLIAPQGTAGR